MNTQQQLERYASVAWQPGDVVEVRALPTERGGTPAPSSEWFDAGSIAAQASVFGDMNANGSNLYAGILPRQATGGTTDADVAIGRIVWADLDGVGPRAAWKLVEAKRLPAPSMVVNSGHGTHLFWALADASPATDVSALVGDLAGLLGSDASVRNPSRILRLPGFTNHKPPAAPCELMYAKPDERYDLDVLRLAVPEPEKPATPTRPVEGTASVERARRYLATIEGDVQGGRTTKAYRAAAVLVNDMAIDDGTALSLLAGWDSAANSPPIESDEPGELRRIVEHAHKYAKKPRGCKVPVADNGKPTATIPAKADDDGLEAMRKDLTAQIMGRHEVIALPWPRVNDMSRALRRGTVCVIAGPTSTGKSFLTMHVALAVAAAKETWRYLPLEDSKVDFQWRLLAIMDRDYTCIDESKATAYTRADALERHGERLNELVPCVHENPRLGKKDDQGRTVVPPLSHTDVLDWIARVAADSRVVFVDPISQIEFGDDRTWMAEADFMRHALALATDAGTTIVLVAHTVKRPGSNATIPLTIEDIQGSAMISRLCQTVLILDAHDMRTCDVYRINKQREEIQHNRTVHIAKARNASGTRQRVAFMQDSRAPEFEELGVIAPKGGGE